MSSEFAETLHDIKTGPAMPADMPLWHSPEFYAEHMQHARYVGENFLRVVRSRESFTPNIAAPNTVYYVPVDMGLQMLGGVQEKPTLVFPSLVRSSGEIFDIDVRTLEKNGCDPNDPTELYDNSTSYCELIMRSPFTYVQGRDPEEMPRVLSADVYNFGNFQKAFRYVVEQADSLAAN